MLETTGEVVCIVTSPLESAINPLELIGSVMKILSLFMNFFNPKPDPFDIINKKLNEILKKVDTIYEDVKNLIEIVPCEEIKSDYRNRIRELFRDPTEGLAMKNLEQEAIIYAKSCARYESDKLDFWSKSVIKMSQLFVFSLAHCEHIAEYKTDFNLDKFTY